MVQLSDTKSSSRTILSLCSGHVQDIIKYSIIAQGHPETWTSVDSPPDVHEVDNYEYIVNCTYCILF